MTEHLVVVGGGQAAAQAIQTLRQQSFAGAITLLCEEPLPPYQRPPLSKKYLAGELPKERLLLRPESFYAERNVTVKLGCRAMELDRGRQTLRLSDGSMLAYDRLLLATGSRPRRLDVPGSTLRGVHYLRTVADVDGIVADLAPGARVALVGAGFIGLEAAAVLRQRGFAVTVLEALERVLGRAVGPEVSRFYADAHRAAGVELHTGTQVHSFGGESRVTAVKSADGRTFACDVAIIGIGVVPNVELAAAAGLACENGIVIDEFTRTADPHIVAAGDCTNHPLDGRRVRLESVPNAVHQARIAAGTLLGAPAPYSEVPWFWSDQYDLKLQIVGLSYGYDTVVVRGDPAARSFAAFYLRSGTLIAVDAINNPREFAHAKKLVAARAKLDPGMLRDLTVDLGTVAV
jgi:3-phenylpropionate/trans-cinnamate dioxygenase ferredoxin reductase subunit